MNPNQTPKEIAPVEIKPVDPSNDTQNNAQIIAENHGSWGNVLAKCLWFLARQNGLDRSEQALYSGLPVGYEGMTPDLFVRAAKENGFSATIEQRSLEEIDPLLFPVVLLLKDNKACVLYTQSHKGYFDCYIPQQNLENDETNDVSLVPIQQSVLQEMYAGYCIFCKREIPLHVPLETLPSPRHSHWFWGTLWKFKNYYRSTATASLLINTLTLSTTFFTMNVYDRVVPTQAYVTLWSLAFGVAIAAVFEFISRNLRAYLLDSAGKKADLLIGSALFKQTLSVRLASRPRSAGAFANTLREFESVRDFFSSTSLVALIDLPFVILFLYVISMIAGILVIVPIVAVCLVLLVGLLIQKPMKRYMEENILESSLKHAVVIEAVEGIETLKSNSGEWLMQKRWEDYSALISKSSMKSRRLTSFASNFTGFIQQIDTIVLVTWGVYLIQDNLLSLGALIGAVILTSRAIGPLGQVAGMASRYQSTKIALEGLDKLMKMPIDRDPQRNYLTHKNIQGTLACKNVSFVYRDQKTPSLSQINLSIQAGERVAILGRIGSGKSTLLRLFAGLYQPKQGQVEINGIDIQQIDPADLRRNIRLMGQSERIFQGTLRENIMLANPQASSEDFLRVTQLTGLSEIANRSPRGFDMPIGENGEGLSVGQKQLLALSRSLLVKAPTLLLDEPTASMDSQTENEFVNKLREALTDQTVIIVTHRPAMLALVNRIILIDEGQIEMDGEKEYVLQAIREK